VIVNRDAATADTDIARTHGCVLERIKVVERVALREKVKGGGNYFAAPKLNIPFVSSGCKTLDLALGGGWAENRIANIVGDKSSGKTLLAIEAATNFAAKHPKGIIRYCECEAAFDPEYAGALGMPMKRVDFGNGPMDTVEELFKDLQKTARSKVPVIYIVDSLDALSDTAEMARDIDQGSFGAAKAKMMSQLFRRLARQMSDARMTLIVINQIRDKIGVMFGPKTGRVGGHALDFYASQALYLYPMGKVYKVANNIKRPIAIKVRGYVEKNKISTPYREALFQISFGYGVDDIGACLTFLKDSKSLGDLDLTEKGIKPYLRGLSRMGDSEYVKERDHIHKIVSKKWYEIERSFMPTRQKYGA
jgi:protein RecA